MKSEETSFWIFYVPENREFWIMTSPYKLAPG